MYAVSSYSVINRVLRPNGVFAIWGHNNFDITPEIDAALKWFHDTSYATLLEQRYKVSI